MITLDSLQDTLVLMQGTLINVLIQVFHSFKQFKMKNHCGTNKASRCLFKHPILSTIIAEKYKVLILCQYFIFCAISGGQTQLNRRMHSRQTSSTPWTPHTWCWLLCIATGRITDYYWLSITQLFLCFWKLKTVHFSFNKPFTFAGADVWKKMYCKDLNKTFKCICHYRWLLNMCDRCVFLE